MSHFSLLVIGDNIKKQLEPFEEQTDNPKYVEFQDKEDEYNIQYLTEAVERIRLEDGTIVTPCDDRFKNPGSIGFGSDTHKVPEHLELIQVPHKDAYSTFEEFMSDYCGYSSRDKKMGRYGSWGNPNAKWDWWTIGGRWAGYFAKQGGPHAGYTDQAQKNDIDFGRMRSEHIREQLKHYHEFHGIVKGRPFLTWPQVREQLGDDARTAYWSQSVIKDLKKFYSFGFSVDFKDFLTDEESFIETQRLSAISTFAYLHKGQWAEKGKMGWWSIVTNEQDQRTWDQHFNDMLDTLPDNTLLTIVDCHI